MEKINVHTLYSGFKKNIHKKPYQIIGTMKSLALSTDDYSNFYSSATNLFHKKDEKQLSEMVVKLTNEQFLNVTKHLKKPQTMILVSILLGVFGVDRFLLGDIKMGIIKLMTFGGLFVLWVIDIFTTYGRTKTYNFNKINDMLEQE